MRAQRWVRMGLFEGWKKVLSGKSSEGVRGVTLSRPEAGGIFVQSLKM